MQIDTFYIKKCKLPDDIPVAELMLCYQTVTHHFSFKLVDCTKKNSLQFYLKN